MRYCAPVKRSAALRFTLAIFRVKQRCGDVTGDTVRRLKLFREVLEQTRTLSESWFEDLPSLARALLSAQKSGATLPGRVNWNTMVLIKAVYTVNNCFFWVLAMSKAVSGASIAYGCVCNNVGIAVPSFRHTFIAIIHAVFQDQ